MSRSAREHAIDLGFGRGQVAVVVDDVGRDAHLVLLGQLGAHAGADALPRARRPGATTRASWVAGDAVTTIRPSSSLSRPLSTSSDAS